MTGSGGITYQYDGHGRRVSKTQGGTQTYSLYNQQGTLLATYRNGNYVEYYHLGQQLVARYNDAPQQADGLGYTGHLEDDDLELTYMQQRYYDPLIGRFYSNDPVGFTASNPMMFNRYAYANNNPYKFTDPSGTSPELEIELPNLGKVLANALGFDSSNKATETVQSGIDSVSQSVDAAGKELASRTSVSASGTAGHGLGVMASTTVDSNTIEGQGLKLESALTGTAYGASAAGTVNFHLIKPNANASGPVTSSTVMGGGGLGGGLTIQWTPSLGVTVHIGPVAGFSVSSKVGGVETRVFEKEK